MGGVDDFHANDLSAVGRKHVSLPIPLQSLGEIAYSDSLIGVLHGDIHDLLRHHALR